MLNLDKILELHNQQMDTNYWNDILKDIYLCTNQIINNKENDLYFKRKINIDILLDRDILNDAGKISHEIACDKALTEFEKYRVKQDKLYKSDFDLLLEETEE